MHPDTAIQTSSSGRIREAPRLTNALRRFGKLAHPDDVHESRDFSSIHDKLATFVKDECSNIKSFNGLSLKASLQSLIDRNSEIRVRNEFSRLFDNFIESCMQLVGKDTTNLGEMTSLASLVLFGKLSPIIQRILGRGVSVSDIVRHVTVKQEKQALINEVGGSGSENIEDAWRNVCLSLGSLLKFHPVCSIDAEKLDKLMKRCRCAAEDEETTDDNELVSAPSSMQQASTSYSASSDIDIHAYLDWGKQRSTRKAFREKSKQLYQHIFGANLDQDHQKLPTGQKHMRDLSPATAQLRRMLFPAHIELAMRGDTASGPSTSATSPKLPDIDVLSAQLCSKAESLEMPIEQLIEMIMDILKSPKSDEIMQNEIMELIGFEFIELVFNLINNRLDWIQVYQNRFSGEAQQNATPITTGATASTSIGPVSLIHRLLNDPIAMAAERSSQLEANARQARAKLRKAIASVSSSRIKTSDDLAVSLPYVFDSAAEFRATVGFVDSSKLRLPADTKIQKFPLWDSVEFPAPRGPPTSVMDTPRVKISSLDHIGQLVFEGMKELNLIQSIVYPIAYNTSENLLVSAPTGAGKTNVALLTVVQLVRSYMKSDNVIDLKAFKIIYLAPMKALAAEMTETFSKRLSPLGLRVRECTGDMQLTKQEILETQMLISTPEKWDVISRKGTGDATLVKLVKLLIIDEVHLLHEDRGSVIEALVARTLRQIESTQNMIRLVGLSATLPNYIDVARFLCVNLQRGLFYFDSRFRPVPLQMTFMGMRGPNRKAQELAMNTACYEKVLEQVKHGEQVMVFVHARGETFRTARSLRDMARQQGHMVYFQNPDSSAMKQYMKRIDRSSDSALRELVPDAFACHHAGMLRSDRSLIEKLFAEGLIRVLVCTATLAWGVNLPAHAVIIKGTRVYKAEKSDFVDLDVLDVLQIFGRAGRPQFDTCGVATILTNHDRLDHYLKLITNQGPIESTLLKNLHDHLNAEIALGTISNVDEAVTWLSYTYLFIRLRLNPLFYGINASVLERDPDLVDFLGRVIRTCATDLDSAEMVRYEPTTGQLSSTDRGRTASLYYIRYTTAAMVKDTLDANMLIPQLFSLLSEASEFASMKVREEEGGDLNEIKSTFCHVEIKKAGTVDSDVPAKVNALLQAYISRHVPQCHSLSSDMNYVQQNAGRLVRYLFEISLRQGWSRCADTTLKLAKMFEQRIWDGQTPLWQFDEGKSSRLLQRVDDLGLSLDRIREIGPDELVHLLHYQGREGAKQITRLGSLVPLIQLESEIQPITRSILRVKLTLTPDFFWYDHWHGLQQGYWIWVEDPDQGLIYHSEYWILTKRMHKSKEPSIINFTIPIFEPYPAQCLVRVVSDHWLGADSTAPITFKRLILPPSDPSHTDLLKLEPLPVTALQNPAYEMLYNFSHFNPIQTQIFHTLYHQNVNVLLGAPTGSGKTVAAELAIFRVFNETPKKKAVYIAPLKALVRERVDDWTVRIGQKLKKRVVELTGDVTPDINQLLRADLIITTPEKWDGISRSWQQRVYVRQIALIVIDEIHLLGEERGPVLEVLVSRANYIASQLDQSVRVVGLSTALANASDLASWLRVPTTSQSIYEVAQAHGLSPGLVGRGLFNFRPSVRPVPLEVHIQGYHGRHYCPRMATMNKPILQAIRSHSPNKPVLIFVSSRRQTRLTALDLVGFIAASQTPKCWLHMEPDEMSMICSTVQDPNLRLTLSFGIGLHHAGLQTKDRSLVEELFANQKIQILIATSTLAWGVNFPAHLVIVKGTEFYDGQAKRYIDYPITDVLQMMGRAGRPQFDDQGKAVIMVQSSKKTFYKRFLYEPFPVESSLLKVLPDHINAEIVAGTVSTMQEALDYLTWTFFFRRLFSNPSYYGLDNCEPDTVSTYLSGIITSACDQLIASSCLETDPDQPNHLCPTPLGRLASFYYLSHWTIRIFTETLRPTSSVHQLLEVLANAHEYTYLPVRHNEDEMNSHLANQLPLPAIGLMESPHTKAHLLFQAHFSRLEELPIVDYVTDTKSVLDQATRILQAMLDACAQCGWLESALNCLLLMQMTIQGLWVDSFASSLLQLPGIDSQHLELFSSDQNSFIDCLPELIEYVAQAPGRLDAMLGGHFRPDRIRNLKQLLNKFPLIELDLCVVGPDPDTNDSNSSSVVTRKITINSEGQSTICQTLYAETEYVLRVELNRCNTGTGNQLVVSAPLIKSKTTEGWTLILGNTESRKSNGGELIVLKRVPPKAINCRSSSESANVLHHYTNLSFKLPAPLPLPRTSQSIVPRQRYQLTLFLMSTTYLGLDQQVDLLFDVIPAPIE